VRCQDRTSVAVVIAVDFVPRVPVVDKNMSGRETRKHVPTSSNQGVKWDLYRVIEALGDVISSRNYEATAGRTQN
jgi:hypothetical protein